MKKCWKKNIMKILVINSSVLIRIVISKSKEILEMLITNKKKNEEKFLKILEKLPKINDFKWKKLKKSIMKKEYIADSSIFRNS